MRILIGCPVWDRAWILPDWFAAIERQDISLKRIGFLFITGPEDLETKKCLIDFSEKHPELWCFDIMENRTDPHDSHPEGMRIWTTQKYEKMVKLRNELLDRVVCHDPDRFFSLDSDILLQDSETLRYLVQLTATLPAVAPLMYMTPEGTKFPSTMSWIEGPGGIAGRIEYPIGNLFETDIIMAAKMMTRPVYQQVRYSLHNQGEDLGWSYNARQQGFKLYLASSMYCPHIMSRAALHEYHEHGDPRGAALAP